MYRSILTRLTITACLAAAMTVPGSGVAGADAIDGSYIVVYKDTVDTEPLALADLTNSLAAKHDATVTHAYTVALLGFSATMDKTQAESLAADPAVASVSEDQAGELYGTQINPPSPGLDRIDQRDRPLDNRYDYATTASNVNAYILDTGIRTSHQDFGGRAVWDLNTIDSINTDCNGHGTHVAGTVGGATFGVAKGVRLHAVKVVDCSGSAPVSAVIAGIDWVTGHAIKPAVVNMSLGFVRGPATFALENAINASMQSGISYVVAAGNNNDWACNYTPAVLGTSSVISVGAIVPATDAKASFSNWGTCVDLYAPGQGITSASNASDTAAAVMQGTSMSAPHATGVAALYLASHPSASPTQVNDAVVYNSTVDRITGIPNRCCGSQNNRLLYATFNPPATGTNTLNPGQQLQPGQSIRSNLGNHILVMQFDGNLVHYQGGKALWNSGTFGHPGAWANMQTDGNFVIYTSGNVPLWATNTSGAKSTRLVLQDDANLVLYGSLLGRPISAIWSTR